MGKTRGDIINNKDRIIVEIGEELNIVLEEVRDYIKNVSYGSLNPSKLEASRLLAKWINSIGGAKRFFKLS